MPYRVFGMWWTWWRGGKTKRSWSNVCLCAALTGAWPFPLPHHEAARIAYYLNSLVQTGVNTRVAAESAYTHYSILRRDIEALRARGATEAQLEKLDELANSVMRMIELYRD